MQIAHEQWATLDGYALAHGFDPLLVGLDRLCNFVWWYYTHASEPSEVEKFRARLWRPPVGAVEIDARSPWSAENETKGLAAFSAQIGNTPAAPSG